jgi:nitrogen fixation/metabolism regulation signal transduction histidine kinase
MKAMLHRQRAEGTEAALRDWEHDVSQLVDMVLTCANLVALDRAQAQQVLFNLTRNGIEAMEAAPAGARTLKILPRRDGGGAIRIEICDAATGLELPRRGLEPFFTTKRHGNGMGLAICRSIIEGHGGRLWMGNNETRGATVAFTVPTAASEAP